MPPILPDSQILDDEMEDLFDFNWETFDAANPWRKPEDVDGIAASGNRTDGDCSISSVYESDNSRPVVISQIPEFVENAASWRGGWESGSDKGTGDSNDEGMRDRRKSVQEEVVGCSAADWNWDYIGAHNSSSTNTDGYSEHESLSRVYQSDNTVQTPGFLFSGPSRPGHRRLGSVPTPPFHTRSSFPPLLKDCNANSQSLLTSSPFPICNAADRREAETSKREQESEKNISYTHESISQHFGRPLDDARKSFGVSRTAFKAMCREVGIMRWKYGKRNMGRSSSETRRRRINDQVPGNGNFPSVMPPAPVVAHTSQNLNTITVKVTYKGAHIRFKLPDSSGMSELEENVIKRLHLERNTFTIKYLDDDGEWILITCDEDVQECIEVSRHLETKTIRMLIDRPVDYNAP